MNRLPINPAWWELIRITGRQVVAFRLNVVFQVVAFMVQLYVVRAIWEAVYAGRSEVDGISSQTLLVYLTISALQSVFLLGQAAWTVQERVLSGDVVLDLIRPFGFLKQVVAQDIGFAISYAPFLLVFVPAALVIGSLDPPSPRYGALYAVSVVLALLVNTLIGLHVGLLAFWVQQVNGIRAMLGIMSGFLSGALVPFWLMPDGVRLVLRLLPFQALAFLPASIYAGQTTGLAAIEPLAVQVVWIGILLVTVNRIWRRAQERIVIHGG